MNVGIHTIYACKRSLQDIHSNRRKMSTEYYNSYSVPFYIGVIGLHLPPHTNRAIKILINCHSNSVLRTKLMYVVYQLLLVKNGIFGSEILFPVYMPLLMQWKFWTQNINNKLNIYTTTTRFMFIFNYENYTF